MSWAKWNAPLLVMNFFFWWNGPGTIDSIKFLECRLRPNTETADMTTRSNFQQIQMVNINQRDARYVAESPTNAVVLWIDDYRTTALNTSAVSHFADTSTETSWILYLQMYKYVDIWQHPMQWMSGIFTPSSSPHHPIIYSSIPTALCFNFYEEICTSKLVPLF